MMIFTVSKLENIASQDCNVISIILDQTWISLFFYNLPSR